MTITFFLKDESGGILVPVLTIFSMFIFLLLVVAQDYYARREFLVNTKDYYLLKTMEELCYIEIGLDEEPVDREFSYNIGSSSWTWDNKEKKYTVRSGLSNQYKRTSTRELRTKR